MSSLSSNWRRFGFAIFALVVAAGLCAYAVTRSFVWDEGFHLLTAQAIAKGRTPYLDFCFPQTLLNAYWNAAWITVTRSLGPTWAWRVVHFWSALCCLGACWLMADFVRQRLAGWRWQPAAGLVAFAGAALSDTLWKFGTCGQAYGTGTLLSVLAFRAALAALVHPGPLWAGLAGAAAGAAAGSTLLTAPLVPTLVSGILLLNQRGSRWVKAAAFVWGAALCNLPLLVLFFRAPRQTWFNVVQYQAIFRRYDWPGATAHDFDVLTAWIDDVPTFMLGLLAIFALLSIRKIPGWSRPLRNEFYLCGSTGLVLTLYISTAHPTFQRYYVFVIPFLSALAAVGFGLLLDRLRWNQHPLRVATAASLLLALALGRALFDDRDSATWSNYDQLTDKIKHVTPPKGVIFADEEVYFLMDQQPPPGMEFSYSHQLRLSPEEERLFHIKSQRELDGEVKAGRYATVESCKEDRIEEMKLAELFAQTTDVGDCSIYWGFKGKL